MGRDRVQPFGRLAGVCGAMAVVFSFEDLFRQEFPRLVRALAVAFDREAAADAVQDAFVAADRHWRRVAQYDDPAGWVRRVALNRLRNERRNQRRRTEILDSVQPRPPDDLTTDLLDLALALHALPMQQRTCVCLHYLGGYTVNDVADALGITSGTVKTHLHHARHNLQQRLEEVDDA